MKFFVSLILLLLGWQTSIAQELVINGGAELPTSIGWIQKTPGDDWAIDAQRPPHSGSYHFYPQNTVNATSELYQDIDVSSNATAIDAGIASYTFSGWRRGYRNTSPFSNDMDRSQIIVEYRDGSGTVLATYDTGSAVFSAWTNSTDTRNAPAGTRTVRIRLISVRVTSSDNDGYYDDISFMYNTPFCTAPSNITLTPGTTTHYCLGVPLTISATVSLPNTNYYYTWYLNGVVIVPASKTYTSIIKSATVGTDEGIYTLRVEDGNTGTASCYLEASVAIILDAATTAGTISSNQEICYGSSASALTGTASTGGVAVKNYKWERSNSSASGPWAYAQPYSTTATGFTPPYASGTLYYRRIDSSGACPAVPTNVIKIRVNNTLHLDPITTAVRDTLCTGESFQLIPHSPIPYAYSINGGFYFTWKKVQGTTTTVLSSGSTMTSYPVTPRPAVLTDSGTYYLITEDGAGATLCKDSVQIRIYINQSPLTKAVIASHQELCLSSSASVLTEIKPASGFEGGPLTYQWYSTADTTGIPVLTKIPAPSSGNSYNPGIPTNTIYYVRKDSIKYCAALVTNFLKIRVNNTPILDSIQALVNDTLCENFGDQFQLKGYLDSLTAGKASINGGYHFTWKRIQGTNTTVVASGSGMTSYPVTSRPVVEADSGTYYMIVRDGAGATLCLDSVSIYIVVSNSCVAIACSKPDAVSIKVATSSNDHLCMGTTLLLQKDVITFPPTPPTFGYVYSWILTNTLGTVVVQGPSSTYQDLTVNAVTAIDTGRYQLLIQDGAASPATLCAAISPPVSIVVYDPVIASRIGNDTIICAGNDVLPFTELSANTGGTGSFTHQWQSSSDAVLFTDIPGITSINYQSPPISSTRYFRRADISGNCPVVYSDTIRVSTTAGVTPGSIATTNGTVCYNTVPAQPLINTGNASGGTGGNGSELYQWQQSSDNIYWTDIAGATSTNYSETSTLLDTTYYRRRVVMGPATCDTAYTTAVILNVYAPFMVGSIGKDTTVCTGGSAALKEVTPATGSHISYQWVLSVDKGNTWVAAPGLSTLKDYTSLGLSDSIWFKRVATSICEKDSSNYITVNVSVTPVVFAGNDLTVQKNTIVSLQGSVTGPNASIIWKPSTGLSNPNILNPDARITHTITYILEATDVTGKCTAQRTVTITVEDPVKIPNVITPNGDGTNDNWIIERIEDYPNASCIIYNRWGNIVWKASSGVFQWSGTNRNGEALPDGTYFYIINLNSNAYPEPYTGYIQLVR